MVWRVQKSDPQGAKAHIFGVELGGAAESRALPKTDFLKTSSCAARWLQVREALKDSTQIAVSGCDHAHECSSWFPAWD
jgi:hypothetical protein